jgi:hypothetical protein
MKREHYSGFNFFQAIPPQIVDAGVTGEDIDTRGYESLTFLVALGALSSITSASYWVIRMQHTEASALGAGPSTYADVEGSHALGSSISLGTVLTSGIVLSIFSDTNFESAVHAFGYRGIQRYVRLLIEEKGNLSTGAMGATAVLGYPANWPVNVSG